MAEQYNRREDHAYHEFLNDETVRILNDWLPHGPALDAGCGCGHIATRLMKAGTNPICVDMSLNMLKEFTTSTIHSPAVAQSELLQLPFPDNTFQSTYCLRVLPHIRNVSLALAELARVTSPGGSIVVDIYNPVSIRRLVKGVSKTFTSNPEHSLFVRYDTIRNLKQYLPENVQMERYKGLRVITPFGSLMDSESASRGLIKLENRLSRTWLKRFAGFLIAKLRVL